MQNVNGRMIFLPVTPLMLKARFFHEPHHMNHVVGQGRRDVSM